ncbi:DUF4112 domain-containing protein [Solimonas variicoloris]|uniref:DUF4112 domain-containing protein n=1 Tax=Solimonas variicoloris TaxID=254408 RepID=UPI00036BB77E|nr:DUF4112 domain-containing protein [Solimonas variicoloris]
MTGPGVSTDPVRAAAAALPARQAALHATRARLDRLAWWLDSGIGVPGTRWRIGVEALIGLIPVVGDLAGALFGSYFVIEAWRVRAPRGLLARMTGNVVLDAALGLVPVVGDLADFAFKSNQRNLRLLHAHLDAELGVRAVRPRRRLAWILLGLLAVLAAAAIWRLGGFTG